MPTGSGLDPQAMDVLGEAFDAGSGVPSDPRQESECARPRHREQWRQDQTPWSMPMNVLHTLTRDASPAIATEAGVAIRFTIVNSSLGCVLVARSAKGV